MRRGRYAPRRFKGTTNGADITGVRGPHDCVKNRRKHMRMLVGVNVGDGHARLTQPQDLRDCFLLDMGSIDAAQSEIADETTQRGPELGFAVMTAGGIEQ